MSSPPQVEIRRSARRRRTVSAYRDGDRIVVLVPARLTRAEEQRWVDTMVTRLAAKSRRAPRGDDELARRAAALSDRWLDGRARPASVRWSSRQQHRWGSCTPGEATIRLSDRLRDMPAFVIDYVLVHELAHLLEPDHSPAFWALVERYPRTERARGFLLGAAHAAGWPAETAGDGDGGDIQAGTDPRAADSADPAGTRSGDTAADDDARPDARPDDARPDARPDGTWSDGAGGGRTAAASNPDPDGPAAPDHDPTRPVTGRRRRDAGQRAGRSSAPRAGAAPGGVPMPGLWDLDGTG